MIKKLITLLMVISVAVLSGCTAAQSTSADQEVAMDEYSDEEVIVESDDGMDPEEMRLREGDGYMMNLVETYTMPLDEGDSDATPDQVLIDQAGKEYKIVEHIGVN